MDNERYKQVKVSINPFIASHFKEACAASDTSMASVLSQFMADFAKASIEKNSVPDYSTRKKRRAAVHAIIEQLGQIKACEECYRDNIPQNLQNSIVYERADEWVALLDEVIELLAST